MVKRQPVERRVQQASDNQRVGPMTPLTRSLWPTCVLTAVVLIGGLLLTRMRLPPLPYSLLVIGGLWFVCFLGVYLWQVQRLRSRRR
jgi:hypothetical protein